MKKLLSNPKKYHHLVIMEAFFVTLAINVIFVFLFTDELPKDNSKLEFNGKVNLLSLNQFSTQDRAKFYDWIKNNDSSTSYKSNGGNGFDNQIKIKKQNQFIDVKFETLDKEIENHKLVLKNEPEEILITSREDELKFSPIFKEAQAINLVNKQPKYPFALGNDGTVFELMYSINDERNLFKKTVHNCIFKFSFNNDTDLLPRLNLLHSSGNRKLDILTSQLLYQAINDDSKKPLIGTIYTVYFSGGKND